MRLAYWRIGVIGFVFAFFVLPVALWLSIEGVDPSLGKWLLAPTIWNAHRLGLMVAMLSVLLAAPIALLATLTRRSRSTSVLLFIIYMPLTLGMVARNYSWLGLFSESNPIHTLGFSLLNLQSWAYSPKAVCLVMTVVFLPWSFFIIHEALRQISATQVEAAIICGASFRLVLRLLFTPILLRASALAFLLSYTSALGYFITPRLIGGGNIVLPGNDMLVLVNLNRYSEASSLGGAFLITCIPGIAAFLWLANTHRGRFVEDVSIDRPFSLRLISLRRWICALSLLALPGLYLSLLPVAYTFIWSLFGTDIPGRLSSRPSLAYYSSFLSTGEYRQSFLLTLCMAAIASFCGLCLILLHSYGSRLKASATDLSSNIALLLPLLVPQVVFAMALLRFMATFHLPVAGIELLAMTLLGLPVSYLILTAARPLLPAVQVLASRSQGASAIFAMRSVVLPALERQFTIAFLCMFFLSFDELVVASFVWHSQPEPIARKLFYELNYSSQPTAAVVSALLIATCSADFLLFRFLKRNRRSRNT